jgi:hypothetical protein
MKVVQSFWSQNQPDITTARFGWQAPQYNWLSWILSANQLARYYPVELYTDQAGHDLLIDKLQLPYAKVHVVLDELNRYHKDLWAMPKIKTYSLQQGPFLHVDGDVFIWEPFPEALLQQGLIAQNLESTTLYYKNMWDEIKPKLLYIPAEMDKYVYGINNSACNMGIVGGHDLSFFKAYTATAFEFVDRNQSVWNDINGFNFNIFFEQLLFHEQAQIKGKQVGFLIDGITEDNNYVGFGDFDRVPSQKTYLHLLGVYKSNRRVARMLEAYVLKEYPEYVARLANIYPHLYPAPDSTYGYTRPQNRQMMQALMEGIQKGTAIVVNNNFFLARDFCGLELPQQYDDAIAAGKEMMLVWLPGNRVAMIDEEKGDKALLIDERDGYFQVCEMDEVDAILIEELGNPKTYTQLMKNLKNYLDEEALEAFAVFEKMVADRLRYFIASKALVFYEAPAAVIQQKPNSQLG